MNTDQYDSLLTSNLLGLAGLVHQTWSNGAHGDLFPQETLKHQRARDLEQTAVCSETGPLLKICLFRMKKSHKRHQTQ